jgi:hypothetical protein
VSLIVSCSLARDNPCFRPRAAWQSRFETSCPYFLKVELDFEDLSGEFLDFVEPLRSIAIRPEFSMTQIPAPRGIAPQALAVSIEVNHDSDSDHGVSRLVFCFDPSEPEGWQGPMRIIGYAKSPIETYMAKDEILAELPWQWLTDSLSAAGAGVQAQAGTTTSAISTGHGSLAGQSQHAELELRASWAPVGADSVAHLRGWVEFLALISGLPPADSKVSVLK